MDFVCKYKTVIIVTCLILFAFLLRWCNSSPKRETFHSTAPHTETIRSDASVSVSGGSNVNVSKEVQVHTELLSDNNKSGDDNAEETDTDSAKCDDDCKEAKEQVQPLVKSLKGLTKCLKNDVCQNELLTTIDNLTRAMVSKEIRANLEYSVKRQQQPLENVEKSDSNDDSVEEQQPSENVEGSDNIVEGFADLEQVRKEEIKIATVFPKGVCPIDDVSNELNVGYPDWMSFNRETNLPLVNFGRPYLN